MLAASLAIVTGATATSTRRCSLRSPSSASVRNAALAPATITVSVMAPRRTHLFMSLSSRSLLRSPAAELRVDAGRGGELGPAGAVHVRTDDGHHPEQCLG